MAEIHAIRHERIDDVPLIIGVAQRLGLDEILNRHLGTHGLHQGLHNGQLAVGWLAYILSQGDHRKSVVQEWASDNAHTLEQLLEQPIRDVEFNDDRLGGVLHRLSDDDAWAAIERDLWVTTVTVYEFVVTGVRLDSTTSYGYHQPHEDGLLQYGGHSKDQRPDLPQLKLMAAAAEPSGHLMASDVVPGQRADDPLYVPLIQRVRAMMNQSGLLYAGDTKMAALATRAHIAAHQDYYVVPLPHTGQTADEFATWVAAIVDGEQMATLVWDKRRLLGGGYEFERELTATVDGQPVTWMERVLVIRSLALAHRQAAQLEKRLAAAQAAIAALTPAPGPGKRQISDEATLQTAIERVLERYGVHGLLTVTWTREDQTVTRYQGPGRPGPNRPTYTKTTVRYVITQVQRNEAAIAAHGCRLGWRAYATNAPAAMLPLPQVVVHYRGGWCLERDFHLVKDLPLGLQPLFVWQDDQITGLVRLLTLGLRLLTLIETQVRRGLTAAAETLTGLYEGQPSRATDRPTGKRILKAFARAKITLTRIQLDTTTHWHVTPLSPLHEQILGYLRLPLSLYADLAHY
jgi:transposase